MKEQAASPLSQVGFTCVFESSHPPAVESMSPGSLPLVCHIQPEPSPAVLSIGGAVH